MSLQQISDFAFTKSKTKNDITKKIFIYNVFKYIFSRVTSARIFLLFFFFFRRREMNFLFIWNLILFQLHARWQIIRRTKTTLQYEREWSIVIVAWQWHKCAFWVRPKATSKRGEKWNQQQKCKNIQNLHLTLFFMRKKTLSPSDGSKYH